MPEDVTGGRLIAIGDIHGCATALKTLVKAVDPRPEDTVLVLGDVIVRGPESWVCVRQVISPSAGTGRPDVRRAEGAAWSGGVDPAGLTPALIGLSDQPVLSMASAAAA
jgi:hypothetical protein